MSAHANPKMMVLRCYGYRKDNKWYGVCLDLNIAAEAKTAQELKTKIAGMINSYIETVFDTADKDSLSHLLRRRAPLSDWLLYYYLMCCDRIRRIPDKMIFNEVIPFKLAYNC